MNCRHCNAALDHVFLDLGSAPPSNAYLSAADLRAPETCFPLRLHVCSHCWLVQTEDYARADELFSRDYAYFSSTSQTWLAHAAAYAGQITRRLDLGPKSFVIEVASNDGYLLKNFVAAGIPCLGIEPTASTAQAAESIGVPTLREFFGQALGERLATEGRRADLIAANNVFAHVPDINDFTRGLKAALKPGGTITLEFPHLMQLIAQTQFDTVYHEHFSYLSLHTVQQILAAAGLRVLDVEMLPTHGGSLRVYGGHADDARAPSTAVKVLLQAEEDFGLRRVSTYLGFQARADAVKDSLVTFLIEQKRAGRSVAAYGAAAKGNTLLNYAGVRPDLLPFVCDAAPSKQGRYLPGSRIPVVAPAQLRASRPDVVLILPWNIADEVREHHGYVREWGGRFAVAVPEIRMLDHAGADVPKPDLSLVISQPMLFPWVGMLEQIRLSDTYVFYDDVQFSTGPGNRVSRVQVKTRDGMRWLTVPLRGRHLGSLIGGLELDDRTDWRGKSRDLLRHAYASAPYVQDMLALVDEVFSAPARYLSELSRASTMVLARYFGLDAGRTFLDSSALDVAGHSSQRVFALCQRLGATRYVTGHGAKRYLDHELFERAGIAVEYMDYRLSPYSQRHGDFTPYVTGLDLVANCGRDGVRHICSGTTSWRSACAGGAGT